MPDIILSTFNARYAHSSFALRYLKANLGELESRAEILEWDLAQRPIDAIERVLESSPRIVAVGVYIWNAEISLRFVAELKRVRPDVIIVIGGPEVSHETDRQEIVRLADHTLTGEADLAFADLCRRRLAGESAPKFIAALLPTFDAPAPIALPYRLYDAQDIAHRVIYVEASRGCPFRCEFCLSSLDVPLRTAPLESFLREMQQLLDRGVRQFKFVDRTFNLNAKTSSKILTFFLDRMTPGLFLHFEMIPDRLPEALKELIARFGPGSLQFEVGVQTFDEQVAERISRRQDNVLVESNLRWLRDHTHVHVHADLIAGLPGEDLRGFGRGFDRLIALGPQEIQVGILKRLRGAPIARHDEEWEMVYSPHPPYEILRNRLIDFATTQRLHRFARYWDLFGNSGNFVESIQRLWMGGASPFERFLAFGDWLFIAAGNRTHGLALDALADFLLQYLTQSGGQAPSDVAKALWNDWQRAGRRQPPQCAKPWIDPEEIPTRRQAVQPAGPARQSRHHGR